MAKQFPKNLGKQQKILKSLKYHCFLFVKLDSGIKLQFDIHYILISHILSAKTFKSLL